MGSEKFEIWVDALAYLNKFKIEWIFPELATYNCEVSMLHTFACNPAVGEYFYDLEHCCEELVNLNDHGCLCDVSVYDPAVVAQYDIGVAACPAFTPQCP